MQNVTAPRRAGWLTTLIQQARASGVENGDIASALEGSIVVRRLTIGRDGCDRLVGRMTDEVVTPAELFDLPADDR